jgi:hypothetical protein
MIKWSNKHIVLVAIFFFTAFVGVFTTNALCDLEIIEYAPNLAHSHANKSGNSHHQDSHTQDHHTSDNDHHASDSDNHNSDSDDPCCEDVASQLEASLFTKIIKNQNIEAKYFLIGENILSSILIFAYQPVHTIYHEYDDPPPLNGFGIRILVQSFLN